MPDHFSQDISVGKNLKRLRKKAGLTQLEVAAQLQVLGHSVSREIISQMERGKHGISLAVLSALKEIYEVKSFDEFFQETND